MGMLLPFYKGEWHMKKNRKTQEIKKTMVLLFVTLDLSVLAYVFQKRGYDLDVVGLIYGEALIGLACILRQFLKMAVWCKPIRGSVASLMACEITTVVVCIAVHCMDLDWHYRDMLMKCVFIGGLVGITYALAKILVTVYIEMECDEGSI